MAVEVCTYEEMARGQTGDKAKIPDDGPWFAVLAIALTLVMGAYEGGWVASGLAKIWSGFPAILTMAQIVAGLVMMVPILFSFVMMIYITSSWYKMATRTSISA